MSDALLYPPPPYSLMTEPPTEASAELAACKPERSSCLCLPQAQVWPCLAFYAAAGI